MVVIMKPDFTAQQLQEAIAAMKAGGVNVMVSKGSETTILGAEGNAANIDQEMLEQLPGAQEPQRDNAYAALLDCCALEDGLMQYLIEVLRTGDAEGFYRLARVTTRTDVKPEAFLAWLGSLEDRAEPEERECAQIMDGCLRRLVQEGRGEVAAALISGDEQTFTAFRREAPELRNRPEATVEWFLTHYVDTYYPIRFLLAANGVEFPKSHKIN